MVTPKITGFIQVYSKYINWTNLYTSIHTNKIHNNNIYFKSLYTNKTLWVKSGRNSPLR